MFGAKAAESSSLNGFRYTAFEKAFGPIATVKNALHKGVDASRLPPCEAELQQHTIFIGLDLLVTVVSRPTGQTHNFGNLRPAIP